MATPEAYRLSIRKSLFAVVLDYLRNGTVDPANFPTFPTTQNAWTFMHNGQLYYFTYTEVGYVSRTGKAYQQAAPFAPGVTLEFLRDVAEPNQDLPQKCLLEVQFRIKVPWEQVNQGDVFTLQQNIDNALQATNGKILITDFTQAPPVAYGEYLENQSTARGTWDDDLPTKRLSDRVLRCEFGYEIPESIYNVRFS